MTTAILTNEQIIEKFRKAFIYINKVETKGRENGMICTVYRNTPLYFSSYFLAHHYFNSKSLLN